MRNLFNSVQMTAPQSNTFDLTHDVKFSANMGELVPTCLIECVPGDKFNISPESLIRFAPLVSPVMHRMDVSIHYFFVPHRLVWHNWERYFTGSDVNGSFAGPKPVFPYIVLNGAMSKERLVDYLGIPPQPASAAGTIERISAIPFAVYQRIWFDYYRDQNLMQGDVNDITLQDGDNTALWPLVTNTAKGLGALRLRCWEHDYFTAALPWAQRGNAVYIPVGGQEVVLNTTVGGPGQMWRNLSGANPADNTIRTQSGQVQTTGGERINLDPNHTLQTAAAGGSSGTINDLRRAYRLQEWLERAARGGSRYIESILAHFGVRSSDKRLQRPEYITGIKTPVVISEVLNTTGTDDLPQGNMAGHGVSVTGGKYGSYYCEEHGYIMGIMSVMPKTAYQQGIPKHWLKINSPEELYFPSFANLGEQPVENRELYCWRDSTDNPLVTGRMPFGYVPRYAEYKYEPNRVAGDFRGNLDFWHLGRKFATPPALNKDFVECKPDHRIFAVTDPTVQKLYCHVLNKITARRKMPVFGTPSL